MKPTLSIIGCGTVGRTLGFLWHQHNYFDIQNLFSRSSDSAIAAQKFIGSGSPRHEMAELTDTNIYLISTSDDQIESAAKQLAGTDIIKEGDIVFHCSGALPSDVLEAVKERGASIACAHPIKSFTDSANASQTFEGTYCTLEGDKHALVMLQEAFQHIKAHTFAIDKDRKALYHTSTTIICNYLCALMEVGFDCLEKSGLDRAEAQKAVEPLATETLKNIFISGTKQTLTGPIARGDIQTVRNQIKAIETFSGEHLTLFEELGKQTLKLAANKISDEKMAGIGHLLSDNKN